MKNLKYRLFESSKVRLTCGFMLVLLCSFTANRNSGTSGKFLNFEDAPETVPSISTSIKEWMYTDVSNQISLIETPEPNQYGSAVLNHPIKLPPGRQNMTPVIDLVYNSDNGNGWTGLGWNIGLPSIEVETRWGVPRYDSNLETETYIMNGDQLAPVAHRGELKSRESEKVFHPRVEHSFDRIVRHGSSPANYWWEVTSKEGITSYYGGSPGSGVSAAHVLRADAGNIAMWAVVSQIDRNGNTINYDYQHISNTGVVGSSVVGRNLYPASISYTGFEGEDGPFRIDFVMETSASRLDVEIDCRYGFKRVTAHRLDRIDITFKEKPVRSYVLNYTTGAFYKTLLSSISELDDAGELFYQHTFEYYDDIRSGGVYQPYSAAVNWDVADDEITGPILNPIDGVDGSTSMLGGAGSKGFSVGVVGTIGFNDLILWSKINTIGGGYEQSNSEGNGLISLVDIDGDGLPDKLYKKNDALYYRKNLAGTGIQGFGSEVMVEGISEFNSFKSRTHSVIGEAHPGGVFVGYTNSTITNTISTYLSDFNGDGLVDIARNGSVFFNAINAEGHPVFSTSSAPTPSPILPGAGISDDLIVIDPDELENQIDESPLHDMIRFWEAPRDGTVDVTAPVKLFEDNSTASTQYGKQDGVRVTIQHNDQERWIRRIEWGDFDAKTPSGVNGLIVEAGDRIYFRVQSVFDGAFDRVIWNPVVTYTSEPIEGVGPNGKDPFAFKASEDFTLASGQSVTVSVDGELNISGQITKPVTSDDIIVYVTKTDTFDVTTNVLTEEIDWDSAGTFAIEAQDVVVTNGDAFEFLVFCNTNVDWAAIKWIPRMVYTESYVDTINVVDSQGNALIDFCPAPSFKMYTGTVSVPEMWVAPEAGTVTTEAFTPDNPLFGVGVIAFSIKGVNKLIHSDLHNFGETIAPISFDVESGDTVYFELHTDFIESETGDASDLSGAIQLTLNGGDAGEVELGVHCRRPEEDILFGPMYRNWGHIVYNGNRERADEPIDEDLLIYDEDAFEDMADDVEDVEDADDLEGMPIMGVAQNPYVILFSEPKQSRWSGSDDFTYLRGDTMSASRLGEDDLLPGPGASGGGDLDAVSIETKVKAHSVAAGASAGPASGAIAGSLATTTNISDVADFNGDQYPDLISDDKIQYTLMTGGREENVRVHNLDNHVAKSEAIGFSIGGEYNISNASNSGGSSGSGSTNSKSKAKAKTNKAGSKSNNGSEGARSSVGLGGGYTNDSDYTQESWLDINGDGLVDKVYDDGRVRLNVGYGFLETELWGFSSIWAGRTQEIGLGGGISLGGGSFQLGVSGAHTTNTVESGLFDFNSDGLLNMITSVEPLKIRLNTGNGFATEEITWSGVNFVNRGSSDGQAASTAVTVCAPILAVKVCLNPSGAISSGVSRQLDQIHDVDGDGFSDVLHSESDGELSVRKSKIGRTNLLKQVNRPMGGKFELSYEHTGSTYELPYVKWCLSDVMAYDGIAGDGPDAQMLHVDYADGFHNRHEREFYGFGKVRIIDMNSDDEVYRVTRRTFDTRSFYHKGVLLSSRVEDSDGNLYDEVNYRYELRDIESGAPLPQAFGNSDAGVAFVALVEVTEIYREGDDTQSLEATMTFDYDLIGNITEYIHSGNGSPESRLKMTYEYHDLASPHVKSEVMKYTAANGSDEILRQWMTTIDDNGNVDSRTVILNAMETATNKFQFDKYGNIVSETRPENYKGERLQSSITFDSEVNTYPIAAIDGYGYETTSVYDPIYGQVLSSTDLNGNTWEFTYDNRGRLKSERSPNEINEGKPYLRKYTYDHNAQVPYGTCQHYDPEHDQDIVTYAFYDGFGREIQTKTPVEVYRGGNQDALVMRVSGKRTFDEFGRLVKTELPFEEPVGGSNSTHSSGSSGLREATYAYDIMDRVTDKDDHDASVVSYRYSIQNGLSGNPVRITHETSPLGRITETHQNARGRTVGYRIAGSSSETSSIMEYNAASDLVAIYDNDGNNQEFRYDLAGRQIQEVHPDYGSVEYTFDPAGNQLTKITSELRNTIPQGGEIKYEYDHERLTQITYPKNYQNLVQFHYGEPGAEYNRAGRIWLVEDASGGEELYFGPTEEVVKSVRTILLNETEMQTYITEYDFDTWNRIKNITYPDGELLTYTYDRAGMLKSIISKKQDRTYPVIERISYDIFADETLRIAGNGVRSEFTRSPLNRTLTSLEVTLPGGENLLSNSLDYNAANQLVSVNSTGAVADVATVDHNLLYDDLHRLVSANGTQDGASKAYEFTRSYDSRFNIAGSSLSKTDNGEPVTEDSYQSDYAYGGVLPNAPSTVRGIDYEYDGNGNLVSSYGQGVYTYKQFLWDEEDRLQAVSDNGKVTRYTYDAFGRRVIKGTYGYQGVFVNGDPAGFVQHTGNYTIYVNGLMSVKNEGFVKHYFTENSRVASKNGVGKFNHNLFGNDRLTAGDLDYAQRARLLRQQVDSVFATNTVPPGPPTIPWYYVQPEISGQATNALPPMTSYALKPPPGWPGPLGPPDTTGPPGPPTWFPEPIDRDSLLPGYNFVDNANFFEEGQFYYHRDVFGSTNFVTDQHGKLRYHVEYLPSGEIFELESDGGEVRPNLYADRDLDEESGFIYFEGYYLDPGTGLFANAGYHDQYAGLGNYAYDISSTSLDSGLMVTSLKSSTEPGIKYASQAGVSNPQLAQAGYIGISEGAGAGFSSNKGNDGDDDSQKKDKRARNKQGKANKNVNPVDDPRDVQFKRRARKQAKTGKNGTRKIINHIGDQKVQNAEIRKNKRKAIALSREKQRNRTFVFAPGDIGTQAGDRRAVRLGGARYKTPARNFQKKPGRTR